MPQTIHNMPLNSVVVCVWKLFHEQLFFSGEVWDIQLKFHLKGCDMFEEDIEITWFKAEKMWEASAIQVPIAVMESDFV